MSDFDRILFDDIPTQEELVAILVNKAGKRKIETGMANYGLNVRRSVRGLWKGYLGLNDFINSMTLTIRAGFTRAWHDGISS